MKKFLLTIFATIGIPVIIILGVFLYTDPFRTLHTFNISDIDATNREYLSTELFKRNVNKYNYNSFVFSSSRGCGVNTYTWKMYLSEEAQPYLFQAWSETITGVQLKMEFLQNNNIQIDNALILIDIPSFFANNQLPYDALSMKHYIFTQTPKYIYNAILFCNFLQKPSLWIKSLKKTINNLQTYYSADTITNDWQIENSINYSIIPPLDSLKNCSEMTRNTFLNKIRHINEKPQSRPVISEKYQKQLKQIKSILDNNNTNYQIIVTPGYYYTSIPIDSLDLSILQDIFGKKYVHDFSGENEITTNYNYFSDPGHFGLRAGFVMLQEIYDSKGNNK